MIFVTVGNASQSFNRLLRAMDELAGNVLQGEPVVMQSGTAEYRAVHCTQRDYFPSQEFVNLIQTSRIVVCHGGAGTLHHVFQAGKVPVVMPRRMKYGEHVEDQLQLVKAIAIAGRIIPAYEPEDLPAALAGAGELHVRPRPGPPELAINLIRRAITELCPPLA
jgi:UDP-N-acetylglucosamine transferase subunit ALG13